MARHRYPMMRQGVTLTGLGTPTFEKAIEATREIYDLFDRVFEDGQLEPDTSVARNEDDSAPAISTLDLSNRYLTPTRGAQAMVGIPVGRGVDPQGYLTPLIQEGSFIHGEDNEVRYYKCMVNEKGEKRQVAYNLYGTKLSTT